MMKFLKIKNLFKSVVIVIILFTGLFLDLNAQTFDPEKFEIIDVNDARIIYPKRIKNAKELKELYKDIAHQKLRKLKKEIKLENLDFHGLKVTYPKGIKDPKEIIKDLESIRKAIIDKNIRVQMSPGYIHIEETESQNNMENDKKNRMVNPLMNYYSHADKLVQQRKRIGSGNFTQRNSQQIDYSDWKSRTGKDFATIDFLDADCETHPTKAMGINDLGHIIGNYVDNNRKNRGFLYVEGEYYSLDYKKKIFQNQLKLFQLALII